VAAFAIHADAALAGSEYADPCAIGCARHSILYR
jgi:hypothetical protein